MSEFVATITEENVRLDEYIAEANALYDGLTATLQRFYRYDGRGRSPSTINREDAQIIYCICRLTTPSITVETGVSDGVSSAIILAALAKNDRGSLVSIDFPLVGIPRLYNKKPGWVVPDDLRARWSLFLGRSRSLLPQILAKYGPIDLFFHDSEHSFDCMAEEFEAAMSSLKPGGVVLSDDASVSDALRYTASRVPYPGGAPIYTRDGFGGVRGPSRR